MKELQQQFALKLQQHWRNGDEIIFIDECSVHPWNTAGRKCWQRKDQSVFIKKDNYSQHSISVQGAISNKRPGLLWQCSEGNNTDFFLLFLRKLLSWPFERHRTLIVLDLATYHSSRRVKRWFDSHGISVLYLPPSSSELNPIEHCWAHVKERIVLHMASQPDRERHPDNFPRHVGRQLDLYSQGCGTQLANSVLKQLLRVFRGHLL